MVEHEYAELLCPVSDEQLRLGLDDVGQIWSESEMLADNPRVFVPGDVLVLADAAGVFSRYNRVCRKKEWIC